MSQNLRKDAVEASLPLDRTRDKAIHQFVELVKSSKKATYSEFAKAHSENECFLAVKSHVGENLFYGFQNIRNKAQNEEATTIPAQNSKDVSNRDLAAPIEKKFRDPACFGAVESNVREKPLKKRKYEEATTVPAQNSKDVSNRDLAAPIEKKFRDPACFGAVESNVREKPFEKRKYEEATTVPAQNSKDVSNHDLAEKMEKGFDDLAEKMEKGFGDLAEKMERMATSLERMAKTMERMATSLENLQPGNRAYSSRCK